MRIAFWKRNDSDDPFVYRPILLDQAGAGALRNLATERASSTGSGERNPRQQKAQGPSLPGRAKRILLPAGMLAFGALVTVGMAAGAAISITDGDGMTRGDAFRLAVIALLSLMFLGQLFAMLRMLPGARWLAARFERPPPPPPPQPLLDQVPASLLSRTAPEDLGVLSRGGWLRSWLRRMADLGSWVGLVIVAVGVTFLMAAGAALGAWSTFWQGGFGFAAVIQIAFLGLAGFGLFMLATMGLRGVRQRRQRRRKRLLRRLLRFLLRLFDSGRHWAADAAGVSSGGGIRSVLRHPTSPLGRLSYISPGQFGRALVLTAAVAGLALYPAFAGDGGSAGASGSNSGEQLSAGPGLVPGAGTGGSGGSGSVIVPATPVPPTEEPVGGVLGAAATSEPDEDDDDAGGGGGAPGGPSDLTDPSSAGGPTAEPTSTPTATATATSTPVPCVMSFSSGELDFGDDDSSLGFTIGLNDCGQPANYAMAGSASWITISPSGGTLPSGGQQPISVLIDRNGLAPGQHAEEIEILTSLGSVSVEVFVEVLATPTPTPTPTATPPSCVPELTVSPDDLLDFGIITKELPLTIETSECSPAGTFGVYPDPGWVRVSQPDGFLQPGNSVTILVSVYTPGLGPGTHTGSVLVEFPALGTFVKVTVKVTVLGVR